MKKFKGLVLAGVAIFALSGCGSSSGGDTDTSGEGNTYDDVYLTELDQGYSIKGYSSEDEEVEFIYCNDEYEYYRDNENFFGTFFIDDDEIEMNDEKGGSYVLIVDTYDNNGDSLMKVDKTYACPSLARDLTVESISLVDCD